MNTADVRNTEYDQKIFWLVALPVTFAVLALALLYGYRWDAVLGLLPRALRRPERHAISYIREIDSKSSWGSGIEYRGIENNNTSDNKATAGWKQTLARRADQKRKIKKDSLSRQRTDDSLFKS
jgi:hypothetical protein